jgi:hypothetical protein
MPPTRPKAQFRQQQQRPPQPQGARRFNAPPLYQVRNLPFEKQMVSAFYHLAAACSRVVHAFSGNHMPQGYVLMPE